jgi:sulfonate transport system substrate-binding protein
VGAGVDLSGVTLRVGDQVSIQQTGLEASGQGDTPYAIEWSSFTSGPPLLEAINADSVDVGGVGDAPPIFSAAAGSSIRVVGGYRTPQVNQGYLVHGDSGISTVADLKGKRIAVTKGSSANWVLLAGLNKAGLTLDDVDVSYLQPADGKAAFDGNSVDAWVVWDPYATAAVKAGAKLIASGDSLGIAGYVFTVTSAKVLEDPALTAAVGDLLKRLDVARAWQRDHQDEWAKKYAELTKLDLSVAETVIKSAQPETITITPKVIADEQAEADAFAEAGVIDKTVKLDEYFDDRFNAVVAAKP